MELIYTPVYFTGLPYDWWSGDYGLKHPHVLVSAGDSSVGVRGSRRFNKPDYVNLIGDSGGFQLSVEGEYLSPETVVEWQEAIKSDVKFILDYPATVKDKIGGTITNVSGAKFHERMLKTIENVKIMTGLYSDKRGVYSVIHGHNYSDLRKWRDELTKIHEFDGWGIGGIRRDPNSVVAKMKVLSEIGVKKIHLFGITSLDTLITVAGLMLKYGFEYCTFDSTTYIATKFSEVWYPVISEKVDWFSRVNKFDEARLICDCPVCLKLNPNESLDRGDEVEFGYKASIHNINYWINFVKMLCNITKYKKPINDISKKFGKWEGKVEAKSLLDFGKEE